VRIMLATFLTFPVLLVVGMVRAGDPRRILATALSVSVPSQ
jgi:hypothetical protein